MINVKAQMTIVPVQRAENPLNNKSTNYGSKIESTHLTLPFWDDFSQSVNTLSVEKWSFFENIWVSHGAGINPPTLNVATFDGVDGSGKLYSLDENPDGLSDVLTSKMFDLSLYTTTDGLSLSFFYQAKGNGEVPNPNDSLRLEFRDDQGAWVYAWSVTGTDIIEDEFFLVSIPIDQGKFLHGNFEFQFKSYGRQSGPYDNWHIDYVYLNSGVSDFNFPDRSLQHPASNLFKGYSAVPLKHYLADPVSYNSLATSSAYNLHNLLQPSNFTMIAEVRNLLPDLSYDIKFDLLADAVSSSFPDPLSSGIRKVDLLAEKGLDPLNITSDTLVEIDLKLFINTDDNTAPDYDPTIYDPIDFRVNDTVHTRFMMHDYYAYDDNTAEYGAGLNYTNDMVVMRFPMYTSEPDTIVSVDFYFPNIGNNVNQAIDIIIFNGSNGKPNNILHDETIVVHSAPALNSFSNYPLSKPVVVQDTFYLGWRQTQSEPLNIGLDKNNDNGSKIFFNLNGTWQQNVTVKGSLMMRPRFGAADLITGLVEENPISVYPNPGNDIFNIEGAFSDVVIYDIQGNNITFKMTRTNTRATLNLSQHPPGIYILQIISEGQQHIKRLVKL